MKILHKSRWNMNYTQQGRSLLKQKGNIFPLDPRMTVVIGIVIAILVIVIAFSVYAFTYKKVFPNTYAAGVKLSGATFDKAVDMLSRESQRRFDNAEFTVTLTDCGEIAVSAKELDVGIEAEAAANAAFLRGRVGSVPHRAADVLKSLFSRFDVPAAIRINRDAVYKTIEKLSEYDEKQVDASYTLEGSKLILYPAKNGFILDKDKLYNMIVDKFNNEDYAHLSVSRDMIEAKPLDIDEVYNAVHTESRDAMLEQVNGEHKITPHVVGVDFDVEAARIALERSPDEVLNIPVKLTFPKVTTDVLQASLFKDTLADVTTYFSPKKVERTSNVRLAAKLVNGAVLNPGEEFSYNKTVGPRTRERGFKEAQIFAAGEIVDGLGGGICQVSSTIYMAALRSDMKITSRTNHAFYVDYAPKGQDATVVYGSIDFKFVNTSKYPIKIVASSKDNYIRITIKGTLTEKKTVKFETKILKTTPFSEKTVVMSSLNPGVRNVYQKGQEGITLELYRLVYDANGKLIRRVYENKSSYKPLVQIIHVGPGSAAQPEEKQPEPPKQPEQPPEPPAPSEPVGPAEPAEPATPEAPSEPAGSETAPESGNQENNEQPGSGDTGTAGQEPTPSEPDAPQ